MSQLPRDLSLADLERIVRRRRSEIKSLSKERDRLQRQLAVVEERLRSLGGKSLGVTRGGRARNPRGLAETLSQILEKKGGAMNVGDIVQGVLDAGYRSNAANFRGLVNQTLIKNRKQFASAGRGMYQLKK